MSVVNDLAEAIRRYHLAGEAFVRGDPEPLKGTFSQRGDVSVANPFGPPARGWPAVAEVMDRAAALWRDGHATAFEQIAEYTTSELACIVEIERYVAKLGGNDDLRPVALRVTTVLRSEDGGWKTVHRHADGITSARGAASILQE